MSKKIIVCVWQAITDKPTLMPAYHFGQVYKITSAKVYPGCQRLFMRGFRFRSSLKKSDPRVLSRGFAARVFGLRPNTGRPTKLLVAREKKTSSTKGS